MKYMHVDKSSMVGLLMIWYSLVALCPMANVFAYMVVHTN